MSTGDGPHDAVRAKAQAYLGKVLSLEEFAITTFQPISGNGLSRVVYIVSATSNASSDPQDFVLLLEQKNSLVAPNRDAEFAILRALASNPALKVASACWVESDPEPLGAPFLLTGLVPGTTNARALLTPVLQPHAVDLITESFTLLGQLAAVEVASLDLRGALEVPAPEQAWQIELARWEAVIDDSTSGRQAITSAAIRWLRRNPPPTPPKVSIVHGDYRLGNYLFETSGITGIIDWEMVHVGDAIEDLAWSLLPNWEFADRPGRIGGFLNADEAIAAWEHASGMTVDVQALTWWTILCHLKAIGLWCTASTICDTDPTAGILGSLIGYTLIPSHEAAMAELVRGGAR